jgi:predicted HTH transcriptional regulator
LADTCACFANAKGGDIIIGIEDKNDAPPPKQKVNQEDINDLIIDILPTILVKRKAKSEILYIQCQRKINRYPQWVLNLSKIEDKNEF